MTGILGGTFDPLHLGHLAAATQLQVAAGLTEVWLMPNCRPPHKVSPPVASPGQRLRMVELGIRGLPGLRACDLEVERGGVSYTVDTLRALRAKWPETGFTLLLGFDAALQIGAWHEVATILREASFVIFSRPSVEMPASRLDDLGFPAARTRLVQITTPAISARVIRDRLALGERVDDLIPPAVATFIREHGLYPAHDGVG